jgi:hypothetical protein
MARIPHSRFKSWIVIGALALGACGGGSDSASPPAGAPTAGAPPAGSPPALFVRPDAAALRLYESAGLLAGLMALPLVFFDDPVLTNDLCYGSLRVSLDGVSPAPRTVLPTGSHTIAVTFANCVLDGLVGNSVNGTASAAYTSADLNDLTALVSANSMRGTLLAFRSDLYDVTAEGSGTWRRVRSSTGETSTYTPTIGSTLVNNLTTNVATFAGGSYSSGYAAPPPGSSASGQQNFANFANLAVAINGTNYVLDGSLQSVYGFSGNQGSHTGEVRITSNGTLMARIYGDVKGAFSIEVLRPLVPF